MVEEVRLGLGTPIRVTYVTRVLKMMTTSCNTSCFTDTMTVWKDVVLPIHHVCTIGRNTPVGKWDLLLIEKVRTQEYKDEVNRREVSECDGWVCDRDSVGVTSIFKVIRSVSVLVRILWIFTLRVDRERHTTEVELVTGRLWISTTTNPIVNNTEIQHQRHRTCLIWQISYQFDVTTMMTPVFNHLVGLDFVRCVKKVIKLINHPVVRFLTPEWEVPVQRWSPSANRKRILLKMIY